MNYTEKDLEDWAEVNFASYLHPRAACIGRQVTLPSGRRLDLLFAYRNGRHWHLIVAELKAGRMDVPTLVQLVRYMDELEFPASFGVRVSGVLIGTDDDGDTESLARRLPNVTTVTLDVSLRVYPWTTPRRPLTWDDRIVQPEPDVDPDDTLDAHLRSQAPFRKDAPHMDIVNDLLHGSSGAIDRAAEVPRSRALVLRTNGTGSHG